jgi:hypothetical protein
MLYSGRVGVNILNMQAVSLISTLAPKHSAEDCMAARHKIINCFQEAHAPAARV